MPGEVGAACREILAQFSKRVWLTRADWSELLEEMVEEHGMTPIEEPVLGRLLTCLGAHYGPDRPNFPRQ